MRRGILIQAQERGATSRRFCAFVPGMGNDFLDIPDDLEALRAALIVERGRRIAAEAVNRRAKLILDRRPKLALTHI